MNQQSEETGTRPTRSPFRFADDDYVPDEYDLGYADGVAEGRREADYVKKECLSLQANAYSRGYENGLNRADKGYVLELPKENVNG